MALDWQNLVFLESDFVYLRGVFRTERRPMSLQGLLRGFVEYRLRAGDEATGAVAYHPYDDYVVGQTVYFPAYEEREVIREIEPCMFLGEKCMTIMYRSKRSKTLRTFIAGAKEYFEALPRPAAPERQATSVDEVIRDCGLSIKARLGAILASNKSFCHFRDWWMMRELVVAVDTKPAYAICHEYGCIDSYSLALGTLGDLDLTRPEDQVKLFSLCNRLFSDHRLLYDPVRDLWREARLYGIQTRIIGRTQDQRKVELHPAPIYPDTPSALKPIRNVAEGDPWLFEHFEEPDRRALECAGEDTYEAVEQSAEQWTAERPKSVSFALSASNILDGFLPLHPEARKLFPARATNVVVADDFGVRFDAVVDLPNRKLYSLDGLLIDYFALHRLESGCQVQLEHLNSESNYHISFRREGVGTVPAISMGYDATQRTATYRREDVEPVATASGIFRVTMTQDEVLSLREASISQGKNTFDLLCEELPRLANVVTEGRVSACQLYDAVYVRRPCQLSVVLSELRRHACFVAHEDGSWSYVGDASLESRAPEARWHPTLSASGRPVAAEEPEAAPAAAQATPKSAAALGITKVGSASPETATAAPVKEPKLVVPVPPPPPKPKPRPKRKVVVPPWVTEDLKADVKRFVINRRKTEDIDPEECVDPNHFDEFFVEAFGSRRYQRYATPRDVADFMAALADPQPGERVIDPCCGTGGLLLATLKLLKQQLQPGVETAKRSAGLVELPPAEGESENRQMIATGDDEVLRALNGICSPQVAGMDSEPMAIEGSKLNLALHGYEGVQLLVYDAMASREIIPDPTFDVVLGNPPPGEFNEENFYARFWELTKPGGRIVTLISPSVLQGPERKDLRTWFATYFAIEALVILPTPKQKDLFGDTLHVLALRKLKEGEQPGETLMAQVEKYTELKAVLEAFRARQEGNRG